MNDMNRQRLEQSIAAPVSFDKQICMSYNHDLGEIPGVLMSQIVTEPEAVVIARSVGDVVETLSFARETNTPVTPRGQASSGFGGSIPTKGGILIDLSEMNRLLCIDTKNMWVDVEPGIVWKDLSIALQKQGLDNCICPTSAPSATVGGWFAMGGVGIGSLRFGSIAEVVQEIDVVGLDGKARTWSGREMQLYYQTCGTLGVITRLRLKCRQAETMKPYAALFPTAEAVQTFLQRMEQKIKSDTIILHSDGYVNMRKASGGHHSIPEGHFLAVIAIPDMHDDNVLFEAIVKSVKGTVLSPEIAGEEWDDRFYPMRIKKIGPTVLVSEFYLPQEHFAAAWAKIAIDLKRDFIGMEAFAVKGGKLAVLIYLPDCSDNLLYPVRMAKAVRPLKIARRYGGTAYTAGLWFAAESREVLGAEKHAAYLKEKKRLDPGMLLNPGKIIGPQMRWLPFINLGTLVQQGSAMSSFMARFLSYRNRKTDNGVENEH